MSESLFMISPGAFTAYQVCTCKHSRMVDDMNFEQGPVEEDGKVKMTITSRPMVCSICKTPYRVMVDARRVGVITNIGE
jgi:hypothetical protein